MNYLSGKILKNKVFWFIGFVFTAFVGAFINKYVDVNFLNNSSEHSPSQAIHLNNQIITNNGSQTNNQINNYFAEPSKEEVVRLEDELRKQFEEGLKNQTELLTKVPPLTTNHHVKNDSTALNEQSKEILIPIGFKVLGSNNTVEIRLSKRGIPYRGGKILGNNSETIIFLSANQLMQIKLLGSNNYFKISKLIIEQIQMNDFGANNRIDIL